MFVVSGEAADVDTSHVSFFFSCRFMLAVIGFFIFLHLYAQRIGMSVAIVCMLNQTALDEIEALGMPANDTESANWNHLNGSEFFGNGTLHFSTESHCSHRLADGPDAHVVS